MSCHKSNVNKIGYGVKYTINIHVSEYSNMILIISAYFCDKCVIIYLLFMKTLFV